MPPYRCMVSVCRTRGRSSSSTTRRRRRTRSSWGRRTSSRSPRGAVCSTARWRRKRKTSRRRRESSWIHDKSGGRWCYCCGSRWCCRWGGWGRLAANGKIAIVKIGQNVNRGRAASVSGIIWRFSYLHDNLGSEKACLHTFFIAKVVSDVHTGYRGQPPALTWYDFRPFLCLCAAVCGD